MMRTSSTGQEAPLEGHKVRLVSHLCEKTVWHHAPAVIRNLNQQLAISISLMRMGVLGPLAPTTAAVLVRPSSSSARQPFSLFSDQ